MKKILIVEDERPLSAALAKQLIQAGYEIIEAFDGEQGFALAKEHNPDLILLDIVMPKMDGVRFLKEMKKDVILENIPVIVLSNLSSGEKVLQAKEQNITEYLIKTDWKIDDIVQRIKDLLDGGAQMEQNQTNTA